MKKLLIVTVIIVVAALVWYLGWLPKSVSENLPQSPAQSEPTLAPLTSGDAEENIQQDLGNLQLQDLDSGLQDLEKDIQGL